MAMSIAVETELGVVDSIDRWWGALGCHGNCVSLSWAGMYGQLEYTCFRSC
jgi:hypothetical protein